MAKTQDPSIRGYMVFDLDQRTQLTAKEIGIRLDSFVSEITGLSLSSDCLEIAEYNYYSEELSRAELIGELGEPSLIPFMAYLDHKNPIVRIAVAKALGSTTSTNADVASSLMQLLSDSCLAVKNEAIISLNKIGSSARPALAQLQTELRNNNEILRANAATAIGSIGHESPVVIELLSELLEDEKIYVRTSAAIALMRIQPTRQEASNLAVQQVLLALQSDDYSIQLATVKGLKGMGSQADSLARELGVLFADEESLWEIRLNALLILGSSSNAEKSVIQPLIKPFVLKALTRTDKNRYFSPSNVPIRDRERELVRDPRFASSNIVNIDDKALEERRKLLYFYESWPIDKRHAFFLTGIMAEDFPPYAKDLEDVLRDVSNDIKSRYNAAFILGFISNPSNPFQSTLATLTSTMNNANEDFDVRWMSALSLAKLGEDVDDFFIDNYLPHPLTIDCGTDPLGDNHLFFEPYFGWCEAIGSGGDGSPGWAEVIIERFLGK